MISWIFNLANVYILRTLFYNLLRPLQLLLRAFNKIHKLGRRWVYFYFRLAKTSPGKSAGRLKYVADDKIFPFQCIRCSTHAVLSTYIRSFLISSGLSYRCSKTLMISSFIFHMLIFTHQLKVFPSPSSIFMTLQLLTFRSFWKFLFNIFITELPAMFNLPLSQCKISETKTKKSRISFHSLDGRWRMKLIVFKSKLLRKSSKKERNFVAWTKKPFKFKHE